MGSTVLTGREVLARSFPSNKLLGYYQQPLTGLIWLAFLEQQAAAIVQRHGRIES